jgi:hydroxyacyl-ACP dehydratase HTD2-like protein with hotdog domain
MLLLTALGHYLHRKSPAIRDIEYKNLAPVYVEEELTICGKPKSAKENSGWDVWIEGKDGGLAVRGTAHLDSLQGT